MSSVDTVFFGDFPYYSNLDESRLSVENTTNQFSFSEEYREQRNITKQTESEKKDESSDLSHLRTPEEQKAKTTPRQRTIVSLIPEYLSKKTQSRKEQITIYFFNSQKRIIFQKQQLSKQFQHSQTVTIGQLIPYVVKSYCKLILNFQPLEITSQSFELKLAGLDNHEDPNIDGFSPQADIQLLYEADNLVLVRRQRAMEKINDWTRLFENKNQIEIIEVVMQEKKEFTLQIEKFKTVNTLKERIAAFSNQQGKIQLLSYYNFKLCDNKRKISDLDQKIIEVYRQKVQDYVDRPNAKNSNTNFTNVSFYEQLWKNPHKNQDDQSVPLEFFVNETTLHGKLTLSLFKSDVIQKYTGGIASSFPLLQFSSLFLNSTDQRTRTLSIHTLVAIKNTQSEEFVLKFIYKNRQEIVTYHFEYMEKKQSFFRSLMKMGRIYNKNWNIVK